MASKLPDALRLLRKVKGWSQVQLARAAGASRRAVIDWEKGRHVPRGNTWGRVFFLLHECPESRRRLRW